MPCSACLAKYVDTTHTCLWRASAATAVIQADMWAAVLAVQPTMDSDRFHPAQAIQT